MTKLGCAVEAAAFGLMVYAAIQHHALLYGAAIFAIFLAVGLRTD